MNVRETAKQLMLRVPEDSSLKFVSYPIILKKNKKIELAIFYCSIQDYILVDYIDGSSGDVLTIHGFTITDMIKSNSTGFEHIDTYYFFLGKIFIENYCKPLSELYEKYLDQLQIAIDDLETIGKISNLKDLQKAFKDLVSENELRVYKKICPNFLRMLHI